MRLRAVSETVSLVVPVQQLLEALRGDTELFRDAGPRPSNTVGEQQNLLLHRVEVTPKAIHGQPPVPALVDIFDEVATRYRIDVVERSGGPPTSSAELTDHVTLRYPEQPSTDVVRLLASAAKLQQSNPGFLVGIVERCFRWRRSEARAQIA
jgi:hypothetical protein